MDGRRAVRGVRLHARRRPMRAPATTLVLRQAGFRSGRHGAEVWTAYQSADVDPLGLGVGSRARPPRSSCACATRRGGRHRPARPAARRRPPGTPGTERAPAPAAHRNPRLARRRPPRTRRGQPGHDRSPPTRPGKPAPRSRPARPTKPAATQPASDRRRPSRAKTPKPTKPTPKPKPRPTPKPEPQAANPGGGGNGGRSMSEPVRLLLADDDVRLVGFLEERLRRDGFAVTVAIRGADALAAVDRQWPDLIILDLMLPDMRGEHVAAEIKRRADLPIIVLSAVSEVSAKTTMIQQFAEDYLTKPFHYPELRARIERVLRRLEDRIPVEEVALGNGLVARAPPPRGHRRRDRDQADAHRDPPPGHALGDARQARHDGPAAGARLGGRGRGRPRVRLGHRSAGCARSWSRTRRTRASSTRSGAAATAWAACRWTSRHEPGEPPVPARRVAPLPPARRDGAGAGRDRSPWRSSGCSSTTRSTSRWRATPSRARTARCPRPRRRDRPGEPRPRRPGQQLRRLGRLRGTDHARRAGCRSASMSSSPSWSAARWMPGSSRDRRGDVAAGGPAVTAALPASSAAARRARGFPTVGGDVYLVDDDRVTGAGDGDGGPDPPRRPLDARFVADIAELHGVLGGPAVRERRRGRDDGRHGDRSRGRGRATATRASSGRATWSGGGSPSTMAPPASRLVLGSRVSALQAAAGALAGAHPGAGPADGDRSRRSWRWPSPRSCAAGCGSSTTASSPSPTGACRRRRPAGGRDDIARLADGLDRLVQTLDRRETTLRRCLAAAAGIPPNMDSGRRPPGCWPRRRSASSGCRGAAWWPPTVTVLGGVGDGPRDRPTGTAAARGGVHGPRRRRARGSRWARPGGGLDGRRPGRPRGDGPAGGLGDGRGRGVRRRGRARRPARPAEPAPARVPAQHQPQPPRAAGHDRAGRLAISRSWPTDDFTRTRAEAIRIEERRLARLVNQVLILSRIETGHAAARWRAGRAAATGGPGGGGAGHRRPGAGRRSGRRAWSRSRTRRPPSRSPGSSSTTRRATPRRPDPGRGPGGRRRAGAVARARGRGRGPGRAGRRAAPDLPALRARHDAARRATGPGLGLSVARGPGARAGRGRHLPARGRGRALRGAPAGRRRALRPPGDAEPAAADAPERAGRPGPAEREPSSPPARAAAGRSAHA